MQIESGTATFRPDPAANLRLRPWLIVSGGFHWSGGMDRANAELARYLLERGGQVHLAGHEIDPSFSSYPNCTLHTVPKTGNSYLLAEFSLERTGRSIAARVVSANPAARVLVNGGNCAWPGVNWIHSVHRAWPCSDAGAPLWFKAKNRISKRLACIREGRSLRMASKVIANSERTRRDLQRLHSLSGADVHTVYLGSDSDVIPATAEERRCAREWLKVPEGSCVIAFVGALSHDRNKGLDTLLTAWLELARKDPSWNAILAVAGGGSALPYWRQWSRDAGLERSVRFLGHTKQVPELLAAADLLVSPVRYEAYGLNVQEALCRGVPAMVSRQAGVAERFDQELQPLLIDNPGQPDELMKKLQAWRREQVAWKERIQETAASLRANTWEKMAEKLVAIAEA